jgi:uncharacterized membrane protein YcaP (DUF421 family)
MEKIFFDSWSSLGRTALIGVLAYVSLVLLLRVSGKRTLSKMNAFDLIVTVALGSTLATVLLNKSVPLADGVLAFGLLIFLQFAITWLSVRSGKVSKLVKAQPTLLFYRGQIIHQAMHSERVTEDELIAALREQGIHNQAEVEAIVLETEGTLSIIKKGSEPAAYVLKNVEKPTHAPEKSPLRA